MKFTVMLCLLMAFTCLLCATDFVLRGGIMVIGDLYGIKEGNLYVLDAQKQLHIIPKTDIATINDGFGDVSTIWLRKADFMKPLPEDTTAADQSTGEPVAMPPLLTPPPNLLPLSTTDKQLQSISAAIWVMDGLFIVSAVVAILTYIQISD